VFGGPGDDVAIGDNGAVLRPAAGQTPTRATVRLATSGGNPVTARVVQQYDLAAAVAGRFGDDRISGGSGVDVLYGQDGGDFVSGHGQADYLEGNGGGDVLRGDLPLGSASTETTVVPLPDPGWPGAPSAIGELEGTDTVAGQDDLIGGSSAAGFRDGGDAMQGDGAADVQLGDNGSLVRTLTGSPGAMTERVYTERYPTGAVPASATVSRTHDPALPGPSTRFCTEAQATCEPAGAFGADTMFGDGGDDGMWGQDGDDTMSGGPGNDDMLGELGNDTMFGNDGEDAMLGDRGGVVNEFLNADDVAARGFTASLSAVPQESYTGFRPGAYDRRIDLLHDVDGDAFVGAATSPAMEHDGIGTGGDDRIRGGSGADNIHTGWGDDLANGDSGGDQVFGADGADVLWGGFGCDPVADAATPDCQLGGVFAAESRGQNDRFVDHVFGGIGGSSAASNAGALGSDVLDFNPRGAYPGNCVAGPWPQTLASGTIDPCAWFEMTDKANADVADNQHHHGTDWIYGGWDRDVLQADRAANGPNPGDRLIDWNGTYNLFTHCNAAYGGFNDVRQHSPGMQDFLQKLGWASGAGQSAADVTTQGTSAFREIAISYSEDIRDHAAGPAYPSTPGHFDDPVSCSD
jgi:Ca2+-binding RTX toxin-like protein